LLFPSLDDLDELAAGRLLLRQVDLLWQRQIIDYLLLRAIRP
jgi:hypothetical protein